MITYSMFDLDGVEVPRTLYVTDCSNKPDTIVIDPSITSVLLISCKAFRMPTHNMVRYHIINNVITKVPLLPVDYDELYRVVLDRL